jgi:hypothetical protein
MPVLPELPKHTRPLLRISRRCRNPLHFRRLLWTAPQCRRPPRPGAAPPKVYSPLPTTAMSVIKAQSLIVRVHFTSHLRVLRSLRIVFNHGLNRAMFPRTMEILVPQRTRRQYTLFPPRSLAGRTILLITTPDNISSMPYIQMTRRQS